MKLITLDDVLFYLYHCRSHGNPIDRMDECLIIIAQTLNELKNLTMMTTYGIIPDVEKSTDDFIELSRKEEKLKTKVDNKSKKK